MPIILSGDQVTVTLPANACGGQPKAFQRLFADVYDGHLDQQWPCSTLQDAIKRLPVDGPMYSKLPALLKRSADRACRLGR